MQRLILGFLFLAMIGGPSAAQAIAAPSLWTNQRESVLTIVSIDPDGKISGLYVNKAPGTSCTDVPFPVTGKATGSRIVFATTFIGCGTVTVWRGNLKGALLETMFEAAYPDSSGHIKIWRGRDTFATR